MILPSDFLIRTVAVGTTRSRSRRQIVELVFLLLPLRDVLFQERQQIIVKDVPLLIRQGFKAHKHLIEPVFRQLEPQMFSRFSRRDGRCATLRGGSILQSRLLPDS